ARPVEEAAVAVPPEVVETPPAAAPEMPVEMPIAASETEETAPEPEMPLPDMAGFAPVQAEDSRLVKVVFFYSDGRFEEYARR
ncbi:MAG: hypothetical protein K2O53_03490, partial [Bacteroidales bacterium]|nr:hypothetical protein [Bacteroidales bacterium]